MPSQSSHEFVITSSVRTEVIRRVSAEPTPTDALLSEIAASDSAVYNALSTLSNRGLVRQRDSGWRLTAYGSLVADSISAWKAAAAFRERDPAFWKNHHVDVIPAAFRRRLPEIGEYEIIRDTAQDPNRSEEVAISVLDSATSCELTTPYYSRRHQEAIPTTPETRVLVTRGVIDVSVQRYKNGHRSELNPLEPANIRLTDCQFASVVTDNELKFELPTVSGGTTGQHRNTGTTGSPSNESVTDTTALCISETEPAVQWGRDLFATLWEDSDPLEPYIRRTFPALVE